MSTKTVQELIAKAEEELNYTKVQRDKLDKRINELEFTIGFMRGEEGVTRISPDSSVIETTSQKVTLVAEPSFRPGSEFSNEMKDLMLSAKEEFNVPGIVKTIIERHPNDPEANYSELSKKASSIANRLNNQGKIEISKKGVGREPNLYKPSVKKENIDVLA